MIFPKTAIHARIEVNRNAQGINDIEILAFAKIVSIGNGAARRRDKRGAVEGIQTYGQGLEANRAAIETRLEYIQEELIDALMYIEWVKDGLKDGEKES